jgi:NAD-dependent SIR2 family protein deacetylase
MAHRKDMLKQECIKCYRGKYAETSMNDDMDGVVHCFECGHEMPRYTEADHVLIVFGNLGDKTCFLDISVEEARERYEKMCGHNAYREPYIFEFNDYFRSYDVWDDGEK